MVYAPVGIKCPECAGQPTGAKAATRRIGRVGAGTGALVTKTLIGINVAVFLISIAEGSGGFQPAQSFINRWALNGFAVSEGEWYRLITSAFLHASVLHIAFNMLMLWWFGRALEDLLGRARFLAIYFVSILAGSAGALLVTPDKLTVGASGAVFGILGAGLILERNNINVFGGQALIVVILNLALSFTLNSVSIGGHVGGLVGGALCILVLSGFGRGHAVYGRFNIAAAAGLVAIAAGSVLIAYFQVRGYA